MFILNIIGWCVFGLVVGAISRFLLPGKDPMSWLMTGVTGVAGSFVFGTAFYLLFGSESGGIAPAGFIGSVIGAVVVLLGVRYMKSSQKPSIGRQKLHSN